MKYTCENELRNFQAWGGGKAVLEALLDDAYENASDYLEWLSEEVAFTETRVRCDGC